MDNLKPINPITDETLKIRLLKKYVDDILVALEGLRPGIRFDKVNRVLTWTQEAEQEDRNKDREPDRLPGVHLGLTHPE